MRSRLHRHVVAIEHASWVRCARFTDELWVPIEPLYQKMSAVPSNRAGGQRELLTGALREALEALASKAPDADWRAFLIADADQLPRKPKNPVRMTRATRELLRFPTGNGAEEHIWGRA